MAASASPIKSQTILARCVLVAFLLALSITSAREGVAAWLGRRPALSAVKRAQAIDPSNPNLPLAASEILAASPDASTSFTVDALQSAVRLGPNRAINWALLGEAYDAAGNSSQAGEAFRRGLQLFPRSPKINWMYANFLIRSGNLSASLAPLNLAIAGDDSLRAGAFDLAWRAGLSAEQTLSAVPARVGALSAYLDYLARTNRLDAAKTVWSRLDSVNAPPDLGSALHYFDSLLYAHQVDQMISVWSALARDYPNEVSAKSTDSNLVKNPGFEAEPLNGGFDWRLVAVEGAQTSIDSSIAYDGSRSLCIAFDGSRNLEYTHAVQYVAVDPNTKYRFSDYARAAGITTDSGPRFSIYDAFTGSQSREIPRGPIPSKGLPVLPAETANMIGTFDWQQQQLDFITGLDTRLIVIQVVRPPSRKLDNKIAGTLWIDSVTLVRRSN